MSRKSTRENKNITARTGSGRVWLQTMPIYKLANAIRPYIPTSSKQSSQAAVPAAPQIVSSRS